MSASDPVRDRGGRCRADRSAAHRGDRREFLGVGGRDRRPFPAVSEIAEKFSVPLCQSLAEVFEADKSDGVVLATPNHRQLARGRRVCRPPGVPMIGEKPIGDSVEGVLTGHHRNCSPITSRAREIAAA